MNMYFLLLISYGHGTVFCFPFTTVIKTKLFRSLNLYVSSSVSDLVWNGLYNRIQGENPKEVRCYFVYFIGLYLFIWNRYNSVVAKLIML